MLHGQRLRRQHLLIVAACLLRLLGLLRLERDRRRVELLDRQGALLAVGRVDLRDADGPPALDGAALGAGQRIVS